MADQPASGWRPPQKPEEWLVYLVGGASAMYILCCLPSFLGPGSLAAALLLILFGAILTLAGIVAAVVAIFFAVTQRDRPAPPTHVGPHATGKEDDLADSTPAESRQQLYDAVVEEMLQSAGSSAPPHSFLAQGSFSGWVWTIPSSKYDKAQALINWPPATEGPKAVATKWWASLRGSTLYLARTSGIENTYLVPVSEMDLSECRVEVLTQGLRSKSRWWRKCPLQISQPERTLLHEETSVAFFAEGSAAKEQWYAALKQAAGAADARQGVEDLYGRFCERLRENEDVDYPQAGDEAEGEASANVAAKSGAGAQLDRDAGGGAPQGRRWGRWWSRRREGPSNQRPAPVPQRNSRGASPPKKAALLPKSSFVNPMEVEQAWMGRSTGAGHLAASAKALEGRVSTASDSSGAGAAQPENAENPDSNNESSPSKPLQSSPSAPELPSKDSGTKPGKLKERKTVHLPVEAARADSSGQGSSTTATPQANRSPSGSSLRADERSGISQQARLPPQLPVEHGVNMLLARAAFDVLRNPGVKLALKAHIQRKMNELRIPDFMHGIEAGIAVVDIDIGEGVPAIHNLSAMPTPSSTIWPQVRFDLDYEGDITVVIETKLDVRDHAAWSQLDKAISRFAGPEASKPESERPAAEVLSPEDSEDEDEESGPLSPGSELAEEGGRKGGQRRGLIANMMALRKRTAKGFRQLAEVTADHLSRMQLRLRLDIKALKGPMYVWVPPPPGDRLWFSFVTPPQLVASATPLVGGRLLKYSYQAGRVSQWIASKLQSSVAKNMVFPSCSDIPLPFLLGIDHPDMAFVPPSFLSQGGPSMGIAAPGGSFKKSKGKPSDAGKIGSIAEAAASMQAQATIHSPETLETPSAPSPVKTGRQEPMQPEPPIAEVPAYKGLSRTSAGQSKAQPENGAPAEGTAGEETLSQKSAEKPEKAGESSKTSPRKGFWGRRQNSPRQEAQKAPDAALAPGLPHKVDGVELSGGSRESVEPSVQATENSGLSKGVEMRPISAAAQDSGLQRDEGKSTAEQEGNPAQGSHEAIIGGDACHADEEDHAKVSLQIAEAPPLAAEGRASGVPTDLLAALPRQIGALDGRREIKCQPSAAGVLDGSRGSETHHVHDEGEQPISAMAELAAALPATNETSAAAATAAAASPLEDPQGVSVAGTLEHVSPAVSRSPSMKARAQPVEKELPPLETGNRTPVASPSSVEAGHVLDSGASGPDALQVPSSTSLDRVSLSSAGASPTGSGQVPHTWPTGTLSGAPATGDAAGAPGSMRQSPDNPLQTGEGGSERERQERAAKWGLPANVMQKNWETFKSRNPKIAANTMQQGKKLAGAMEKLREQAQEQVRKAQDQMRLKQEQKRGEQHSRPIYPEGLAKAPGKGE